MKIGEFSKKHDVTVDTVRHYINEGLLTPLRENTQYNFSEIDDRVMESIILLKSMNFKLEEMKSYLLFQTIFTNNSFSYLGSFREEFERKFEENEKEIQRLLKMNELIKKQITGYKQLKFSRGVSLRMLPDLICIDCNENLELEASEIKHNEILEGKLVCPKCGKTYYIRYGYISNNPIDEFEYSIDVAGALNNYLTYNDEQYILKIRELFQMMAEITFDKVGTAKNVLIDGDSCSFLNSSILRCLPNNVRLFVRTRDNGFMKALQEDLLPKDTVFFSGDVQNIPFNVSMDYVVVEDYDVDTHKKNKYDFYKHLSPNASIICFKAYIYGEQTPFLDEKSFLEDMTNCGFKMDSVYKTGRILNKKDSLDMTVINKNDDIEVEYAIYSFKTLG